jgi:cytoplasmic iron level regulating protein YaaA (DUF328/UPF0246 family)
MEIILIACSGEKTDAGSIDFEMPRIENYLAKTTYQNLLTIRQSLARIKMLPSDLDFGDKSYQLQVLYKPAYLRYSGIVFRQSNLIHLFPQVHDKIIIIISALYGVLDANDYIRKYNAQMSETLPNGTRLHTWWKNNGLGKIVEECIINLRPKCVHDLLPISYRSALDPWVPPSFNLNNFEYIQYNYPGLGNGSLWRRGDQLKKLLV